MPDEANPRAASPLTGGTVSSTTPSATGAGAPVRRGRRWHPWRWWRGLILLLILAAAAGGSSYWWYHSRIQVSTDNVYVIGNITPVSSVVSGSVVALYVDDNMIVQPGDPIAQIDPIPFQVEVDKALADLKKAEADASAAHITVELTREDRKSMLQGAAARRAEAQEALRAAEAGVQTARAMIKEAEAGVKQTDAAYRRWQAEYERANGLLQKGVYDRQTQAEVLHQLQETEASREKARAKVASMKAAEIESKAKRDQTEQALDNAEAAVGRAQAEQLQPKVATATALALRHKKEEAEARLRLARLNLSNTLIRAPQAGIISRRTIQLGETLEARRPFLSIVPLDLNNVWVVANLRGDQMDRVRVGQPVTIRVDAIPERSFKGWVESVAGGTGSVFSLFPPDNATGNFVRVVQRLPVRIRFAEPENYQNRIRPGMSAQVTIDTSRYVRQSGHVW